MNYTMGYGSPLVELAQDWVGGATRFATILALALDVFVQRQSLADFGPVRRYNKQGGLRGPRPSAPLANSCSPSASKGST